MKINKNKFLAGFSIFLGGVKLIPNSVSVGLFDVAAVFGAYTTIKNIRSLIRLGRGLFFILLSIALVQFLPPFVALVQGNLPTLYNTLFSLRIGEYFIFVPVMYFAARRLQFDSIYYSALFGVVSIPVAIICFGHRWGIFQYSWELGAIYSMLFSLGLICRGNSESRFKNSILLLISMAVVLYTNQRSPLLAIFTGISWYGWSSRGIRSKIAMLLVLLVSLIIVFTTENRLSNSISEFKYYKIQNVVYAGLELARLSSSYEQFVYEERSLLTDDGSDDLSFNLRIRKWAYAAVNMTVVNYVVGLGPGYFGGAADSSVLRVFFETGLIGFFLWSILAVFMYKKYPSARLLLLAMVINGIFIDVFYSARTVTVFALLMFWISLHRRNLGRSVSYKNGSVVGKVERVIS